MKFKAYLRLTLNFIRAKFIINIIIFSLSVFMIFTVNTLALSTYDSFNSILNPDGVKVKVVEIIPNGNNTDDTIYVMNASGSDSEIWLTPEWRDRMKNMQEIILNLMFSISSVVVGVNVVRGAGGAIQRVNRLKYQLLVLSAIGAKKRQIGKILLLQDLIQFSIGMLIGLPLTFVITPVVAAQLKSISQYYVFTYPVELFLLFIVLMFGASTCGSLVSYIKFVNLKMSELNSRN